MSGTRSRGNAYLTEDAERDGVDPGVVAVALPDLLAVQRPRLGQPQYHNHQDDDHQHPDNDANDASIHFASVKSVRGQQHFQSGRALAEPSEDCRGL